MAIHFLIAFLFVTLPLKGFAQEKLELPNQVKSQVEARYEEVETAHLKFYFYRNFQSNPSLSRDAIHTLFDDEKVNKDPASWLANIASAFQSKNVEREYVVDSWDCEFWMDGKKHKEKVYGEIQVYDGNSVVNKSLDNNQVSFGDAASNPYALLRLSNFRVTVPPEALAKASVLEIEEGKVVLIRVENQEALIDAQTGMPIRITTFDQNNKVTREVLVSGFLSDSKTEAIIPRAILNAEYKNGLVHTLEVAYLKEAVLNHTIDKGTFKVSADKGATIVKRRDLSYKNNYVYIASQSSEDVANNPPPPLVSLDPEGNAGQHTGGTKSTSWSLIVFINVTIVISILLFLVIRKKNQNNSNQSQSINSERSS